MAKYHFEEIENGQIQDGYTIVVIENHIAEISNDDVEAMLLAEKNGGVIEAVQDKPKKSTRPVIQPEEIKTDG